jgi:hypothetical protein
VSEKTSCIGRLLLWSIVLSGRVVLAGYTVDVKIDGSHPIDPEQSHAVVTFDQNRVKISTGTPSTSGTDVIYTASDGAARIVEHRSQDYLQVDGNMLAAAGNAADIVKNLFASIDQKDASALRVVNTKKVRKLNGIPCQLFYLMRGETRIQELWVTSWKRAGITKSNLSALYAFAALYEQTRPFFNVDVNLPMDAILQLNAFPIQLTQFTPDGKTLRITLSLPRTTQMGKSEFATPDGYVRRGL